MAQKKTDYKTNPFNQELLQCAALCFFLKKPKASNGEFFDYLDNFADGKDPDSVLNTLHAFYNVKNNLGVFHSDKDSARGWVKSAIDIARYLIKKLKLKETHEIHHQNSKFGKLIKYDCIKRISTELQIREISSKPDVYNPTDIWIIDKNSEFNIRKKLGTYIISRKSNIVANYAANENTYRSIINEFYIENKLFQISLKKSKTSKLIINEDYLNSTTDISSVNYKIIGTSFKLEQRISDIDSYTKFLLAFYEVLQEGNKSKIMKFIDDLVEVKKLNYKDEVLQPNLIFELNYENVNIPYSEVEHWKLDTPGNTFNMQKIGGTAWSGGLNTNGIHQILKDYPKYNTIFQKIKNKRLQAYKSMQNDISGWFIDSKIETILNKDEIIYKREDLDKIKKSFETNDFYIKFLVKSIQLLSMPFRGQKELYGVGLDISLKLTKSAGTGKYITVKNKKGNLTEKEIQKKITTLKKGQPAIGLRIDAGTKKGDTVLKYILPKSPSAGNSIEKKIREKYFIFILSGGKAQKGTQIKSIDTKNKTITISQPLEKGSKAPLKAFILDPLAANVVSTEDMSKIKSSPSKTIIFLEEKYSKLQAFYMFINGGPALLNEVLKKQIILTIYGLVSKKGGKLFSPTLTKKVKDKVFAKNALKDFVIPPFIIVGD